MSIREGGEGLSNGCFPWTKWDFCSEFKKIALNCIKCKRQFAYKLYQNLDSFISTHIPNVNVIIKYQYKESMA